MKNLVSASLLALIHGCTNVDFYMGVAKTIDSPDFKGQDPAAVFILDVGMTENTSCQWLHVSHWAQGWPIDNNPESTLDTVGCGYTVDIDGLFR